MFIRIRTVLVIFLTTLIIVSFSVLVGIVTVRSGIETSQEADLMLISDIADHFISGEINSLKLKAAGTAQLLSASAEARWPDILEGTAKRHTEFMGMAIWDAGGRGLIASAGKPPAPPELMEAGYLKRVFQGKEALSTTVPSPEGLVFYLAALLPGMDDKILTLTLPNAYFSDLLSTFLIWNTGHIFMDDAEGRLIANPRQTWVEDRADFIHRADIDPANEEMVKNIRRALDSEARIVRYSISHVPRLCAYRPVSGSEEGWLLGTVAPLPESPFRHIDRGLIVVGIVSLLLSLVAAFIASGFIKRPFEEIAALKEKAEKISKFKSDFLANMSHEIRTPMNAILGVTEIMMQDKTTPQSISDNLSKIYNSGDLLLNIINDILDLSKIEAGKMELVPANYETASLINDTATMNMMRIGSEEVEFKLSVDDNLPQMLFGDELRIKQILNNLLSNAFKYTEKGEVNLSFSVSADGDESGPALVIRVSDTGRGMTAEQVNEMFDQYSRFNHAANRTTEGAGLGMNITQNLVRLMNGGITVESEPFKGSVFTVRLPQGCVGSGVMGRDLAEQLQNFHINGVNQIRKANILYEPMPYGSVLVVDDVESNLFVAKGLMLPYELSVDTAASGFEAIDKIKNGSLYDIVFMDHMMPKMDGVEATKIMRGLGYKRPIVALTANTVKGQQEMFAAKGFDDFISKPVDTRRLNIVLKKFIRDKQPPEVLERARNKDAEALLPGQAADTQERRGKESRPMDIPGLDVNKGIAHFGFNEDIFFNVLRSYAKNTRHLLNVIKENEMHIDNLGEYTIIVHGIKGSSYGVFAEAAGSQAEALEKAAIAGDYDYVSANNQKFLDTVFHLVADIEEALIKVGTGQNPIKDKPDEALLTRLLAACAGYDIDEMEEAMAEIESYEYKSDEGLAAWLRENIDQGKYKAIIEKLSSLPAI